MKSDTVKHAVQPLAGCGCPSAAETELLRALVAQPSFSGSEAEVAALLRDRLVAAGWQARIDGVGNVVAELGRDEGPTLLFLGHMDTAPGWPPVWLERAKERERQREGPEMPGEPEEKGRGGGGIGTLWGRGAVDAKGSLAAFVAGVARAQVWRAARAGHSAEAGPGADGLPIRLVLIGAVGEEADSRGTRAILDSYRPDWCVIGEPSSWDSVTVGYKGSQMVRVELRRPEAHGAGTAATAAEAATGFWYTLRDRLAEAVTGPGAGPGAATGPGAGPGFRSLTCTLREIQTESNGIEQRAVLRLDFRLPPGLPEGEVERLLAEVAGETTPLSWQPEENAAPGFLAPKNSELVRTFLAAIRAGGGRPRFKLKSGTSDMNLVGPAWGCPILAYGPGSSSLDHAPDERLELTEYGRAIEVWRQVLVGGMLTRE